jgi:hypothetical protein
LVEVLVNTGKETLTGSIQLPGPDDQHGRSGAQRGLRGSAFSSVDRDIARGGGGDESYVRGHHGTIGVPNAQTVVSNPSGTQLLVLATTRMR